MDFLLFRPQGMPPLPLSGTDAENAVRQNVLMLQRFIDGLGDAAGVNVKSITVERVERSLSTNPQVKYFASDGRTELSAEEYQKLHFPQGLEPYPIKVTIENTGLRHKTYEAPEPAPRLTVLRLRECAQR